MIRLERISKAYGAPVLRGVTLEIPKGCLYGLVGPGASGKSLLLKVMTGLVTADEGRVIVGGREIGVMREDELGAFRRACSMLFQNNALFDSMSVGDNVAFPLRRLFAPPEDEVRSRVDERLRAVGLAGFAARPTTGLSGGQKKRVGVARATITNAPIVLYDEPAAGLDPVASQRIFDLLRREQQAAGTTVVMVSSDIERLLTVTDRVGMMYRGELIFDGTTSEALATHDPYVRQFVHGLAEGPL